MHIEARTASRRSNSFGARTTLCRRRRSRCNLTLLPFRAAALTRPILCRATYTDMDSMAEARGAIVAYPQGGTSTNALSWNSEGCCASAQSDDLSFALALVAHISARACVASERVYATGWSAGAYFSNYLGCKASSIFTSIAPVNGLTGVDPSDPTACPANPPPRVLSVMDTRDPEVDYNGGGALGEIISAPGLWAVWAAKQSCSATNTTTYAKGDVVCITANGCTGRANSTLCTVDDAKHAWPGASSDQEKERGTTFLAGNAVSNGFSLPAALLLQ